ncbi:hypothetical protein [Oceanibacterium hippocampi]|nr:hypothetical protein [Oceanibacterium hippocampi]
MSAEIGRPFGRASYLGLKAAMRRLVRLCGGLESAAMVTRVGKTELGRYQNPNEALFAPADVIADLEADAGEAPVTRALARMAGLCVFQLPPADSDPTFVAHLGATAKECGEAISRTAEAIGECGTITAARIRDMELHREIAEAHEALAALDAALTAVETAAADAEDGRTE